MQDYEKGLKYCCPEFAYAAGATPEIDPEIKLGRWSPADTMLGNNHRHIYKDDDGEKGAWHVPGCCGGGCNVLWYVRFCPFCGTSLLKCEEVTP